MKVSFLEYGAGQDDKSDTKSHVNFKEDVSQNNYNANKSMYSAMTIHQKQWKQASRPTYETLVLTKSEFNSKVRGAGFRSNGKARHIKKTCLLAKIH